MMIAAPRPMDRRRFRKHAEEDITPEDTQGRATYSKGAARLALGEPVALAEKEEAECRDEGRRGR